MKASDICVGDWVNMGNPVTDELVPTKVENIYGEEINCKTGHTSDDVPTIIYGKWLRYAQPIPLTEDILVKNGFVYREEEETCATVAFHHWQLNGHSFALNYTQYFRKEKKDDMPRFDVAGIAIHYVHQLQHLLRLCGIEKEIELKED